MKSYWFLFWAYAVVWVGIAAYQLLLSGKIGRLHRRLDGLENELSRAERSSADG